MRRWSRRKAASPAWAADRVLGQEDQEAVLVDRAEAPVAHVRGLVPLAVPAASQVERQGRGQAPRMPVPRMQEPPIAEQPQGDRVLRRDRWAHRRPA